MYVHSDTIQCGEWRRVRRRPNGSDIYCDMKEELQTEAVTPTNAIDINTITISDPIEEEDYMHFISAQTERTYPRVERIHCKKVHIDHEKEDDGQYIGIDIRTICI